MESVLRHHHAHDAGVGIESIFVSFFEAQEPPVARVHFLHARYETDGIGSARRRLREALGEQPLDVAIYHGQLAVRTYCPADGARRRIFLAHGGATEFEGLLKKSAKWFDGIAAVSDPLLQRIRNTAPHFGTSRLSRVFTPVHISTELPRAALDGRPIVIGYAGRVTQVAKRSDQLGPLHRALTEAGVSFKLEILGDGDDFARLKSELGGQPNVVFHGMQTGPAYLKILNNWDVWVSVSDSEGTPLSMLEAMGLGCFPVFPRINTGGDAYAQAVGEQFLYPAGDLRAAVDVIQQIAGADKSQREAWQVLGRKAVHRHTDGGYLGHIAAFARAIHEAPRISAPGAAWFPPLVDRLTYAQLAKLASLRNLLRA